MTTDALADLSELPSADRRGRPIVYASYWSARARRQRAEMFERHARGQSVRDIAAEMTLDEHDVHDILLGDHRRTS
jgi:hypothetical protein